MVAHQTGDRRMEHLLTANQLASLPRRALALLLARCARRLQLLFEQSLTSDGTADNTNPPVVATAMAQTIEAVESFAKGECFVDPTFVDKVTGGPTVYAWQAAS